MAPSRAPHLTRSSAGLPPASPQAPSISCKSAEIWSHLSALGKLHSTLVSETPSPQSPQRSETLRSFRKNPPGPLLGTADLLQLTSQHTALTVHTGFIHSLRPQTPSAFPAKQNRHQNTHQKHLLMMRFGGCARTWRWHPCLTALGLSLLGFSMTNTPASGKEFNAETASCLPASSSIQQHVRRCRFGTSGHAVI